MSAREQLLEAGFGLFLERGFDGAGITEILTVTGLSKGAFYHHFKSKQALYEEVIARFFPSPFDAIDWTAHEQMDADAQKCAIAGYYMALVPAGAQTGGDLARYFALFFDSLSRLPAFRDAINALYRRLIASLAAALVRDGLMADEPARREARRFIAEMEGRIYLWAVAGYEPVEQ